MPHLLRAGAKFPDEPLFASFTRADAIKYMREYLDGVRNAGSFAAYEHRRIVALFEAHHIALPLLPSVDVFRDLLSFLDAEPFPDPAAQFDWSSATTSTEVRAMGML